jgi:hypothetical protein|tara:strand:- start:352 stop:1047 length:696 start_codon:yes stop_codon:yes gene_type:complete
MKYYWLTNSIDTKIIGKYPQSESAYNAPKFWNDVEKGLINENLTIPEPILHKNAKLTSYLSSVPIINLSFLILNRELFNLVKPSINGEYITWKIKIHYRDSIVNDYFLFHLLTTSQKKYVDYENSEFYIGKIDDYKWIGESIRIYNHENFLSTKEILRNENLIVKVKKLQMNFKNSSEDFIRINDSPTIVGGSGYYVSEKLKDAIEKSGFTGMAFIDIEEIDNRNRIKVIY